MSQTLNPPTHRNHRSRQGWIHRDPEKIDRTYSLEMILEGKNILIQLDKHRFLTNGQVGELLFRRWPNRFGKPRSDKQYQDTANVMLGRLIDIGLIERVQVFQTHRQTGNVFMSAVNILTRAGAKEVESLYDRNDVGESPRWTADLKRYGHQKIDHELEINDVSIALRRAVWELGEAFDVSEWHDDDLLERAKQLTQFNVFTPDGFCVVETADGRECPIFVEVDRGTEVVRSNRGSTKDWRTKIERYGDYFRFRYRDDPFYAELGFDPAEMANPVVLTLTTSQGRIDTMLRATQEAGGRGAYWYATKADIHGQWGGIFEPIWRKLDSPSPVSLRDHLVGQPGSG